MVVKMRRLGMQMMELVMMSQTFVMEHPHSWKYVGQMNHHNIALDLIQSLKALEKNHMKSGRVEMTMEDAFCDPNSQNQQLHFVTEGGRKRVYPDETANVKADSDIAPACHTKIK